MGKMPEKPSKMALRHLGIDYVKPHKFDLTSNALANLILNHDKIADLSSETYLITEGEEHHEYIPSRSGNKSWVKRRIISDSYPIYDLRRLHTQAWEVLMGAVTVCATPEQSWATAMNVVASYEGSNYKVIMEAPEKLAPEYILEGLPGMKTYSDFIWWTNASWRAIQNQISSGYPVSVATEVPGLRGWSMEWVPTEFVRRSVEEVQRQKLVYSRWSHNLRYGMNVKHMENHAQWGLAWLYRDQTIHL